MQAANAALSSEHSNVEPCSFELNSKLAVASRDSALGDAVDRGLRRGRVGRLDGPGAALRRRIDVARRIDRPHAEVVLAGGEARVLLRRAAGAERGVVERALERDVLLAGGELEARRRARRRRGRALRHDRARRRRVDGPLVDRRRGVAVARGVGRPHAERVRAGGQARVLPRRRAGGERAAVERALERGAGLARGEAEARGRARAGGARIRADRRLRRGPVEGPGVRRGRLVDVAGAVGRAHPQRVLDRRSGPRAGAATRTRRTPRRRPRTRT